MFHLSYTEIFTVTMMLAKQKHQTSLHMSKCMVSFSSVYCIKITGITIGNLALAR